jgi:two-component system cell cycle sensor histidine kinase/response regulator CckA
VLIDPPDPRAPPDRPESREFRLFLVGCAILAVVLGSILLAISPRHNSPVVVLAAVVVPGLVAASFILGRERRSRWFMVAALGFDLEAVLSGAAFIFGIAFAPLVALVGVLVLSHSVRGRDFLVGCVLAWLAAMTGVILALTVGPIAVDLRSSESLPGLAMLGLLFLFGLGLLWRFKSRHRAVHQDAVVEIGAREAAERQLRENVALLRALFVASPLPTISVDTQRTITVWNPAAERLLGFSAEQIIGRRLAPVVLDEDGVTSGDLVTRILSGELLRGERIHLTTADGSEIIAEVYAAALHDDAGDAIGTIGQLIDVTEREATEQRLRESERMQAIGQLAGGVAHDVNNTLTAIGGFASLIATSTHEPETREDAETIRAAVERATDFARQLLAFARRAPLQPQMIELGALVETLEPMLRRLVPADIELVIERPAEPASCMADAGRLEQALLNLVINARDAIVGPGRIAIAMGRRRIDALARPVDVPPDVAEGEYAVIAVSDTGPGIPLHLQLQVFEPFFTTKRAGGGTGLGLAMVHGFVAQSGGFATLESEPGHGTTIRIHLPVRSTEAAGSEPPATVPLPRGGTEAILFLEDDPIVSAFGVAVLKRLGYSVIPAATGGEAIAIARAHEGEIDLLVADVVTPGLTGPEVAQTLTRERPGLAVLFVSGYSADVIAERDLLDHRIEFLEKPYSKEELAIRVRAVLDAEARPGRDDQDGSGRAGPITTS